MRALIASLFAFTYLISLSQFAAAQTYKIVSLQSGKVLDVTGGPDDSAYQNGTAVKQYQYLGGANQQWQVVPLGNGYNEIVNVQSGKVLDVVGGYVDNGVAIQQWEWLGGGNQQWQIIPLGNGYNRIVNFQSGKDLDVANYSLEDGAPIQQYDWLAGANQKWALVVVPTVDVHNVTHPELAPNFLEGDAYEYTIRGLPNQPVTYIQNTGPLTQMGVTDASGTLVVTGVQLTGSTGSYTQVWYVGGELATPAITFIVDQLGSGGSVTTTTAAQTPDGAVVGVSSITMSNGTANTYSATELSYNAQLYYDAQTVGTVYVNGIAVAQGYDYQPGIAGGTLSVPTELTHLYNLQTDHYAVAYLLAGGYYQNPFYFEYGSSCGSDCSYWPGGGAYYIVSASIYLGSTLITQGAAPTAADLNSFANISRNPSGLPTGPQMKVDRWAGALAAALILSEIEMRKHSDAILPAYLQVIGDCQSPGGSLRERTYLLMDAMKRIWRSDRVPVLVGENVWTYSGATIRSDGRWGSIGLATDRMEAGSFTDGLEWRGFNNSQAIQQFWATNFSQPGDFSYPRLDPIFGLGSSPAKVPLAIVDDLSASFDAQGPRPTAGTWGSLDNLYTSTGIGINGDGKIAPDYRFIYRSGAVNPVRQSCR